MIKVILAEAQHIVRDCIRNILEKEGKFGVVGECETGAALLKLLNEGIAADIVLVDLDMLGMSAVELIGSLQKFPVRPAHVVFLATVDSVDPVFETLRNGADGYLLKNISTDELVFALNHVVNNKKYVCSDLVMRMVDGNNIRHKNGNMQQVDFSSRETEILELIASGYTNQQIADKLFTSRRTVEGHRQAMINKARVRNSAELIRFAVKYSLID
jgi:DNA-binding NarL/FixJ family response regulator